MNKWLWRGLGLLFVGCAYIGAIVPGIPMTTFVVLAAWAFAKSSPKLNHWVHTHPTFSPHLIRLEEKSIYPTKVKWINHITIHTFTQTIRTDWNRIVYAILVGMGLEISRFGGRI